MVEVKAINGGLDGTNRPRKRKRSEPCAFSPSPEENRKRIAGFRSEIDSLVKYCKSLVWENRGVLLENLGKSRNSSAYVNGVIACVMEESDLPLSKLVDEIFEKLRDREGNGGGLSKAGVMSAVLMIGQRSFYGVLGADADVLEDEAECALWCWETRDLKLLPRAARTSLKVHRTFRRKIQERISAVFDALEMYENSPNCQHELMKASEKLGKVPNEAGIRPLMENTSHENGAEIADKETKRGEQLLIKQKEKYERDKERLMRKIERNRQKEMLQSEREERQLNEEAQKEERRCEKEEIEKQKQLKRKQEAAARAQRRREKEEAESRKRLLLQKQASLMERFLKLKKTSSPSQNDSSLNKATASGSSGDTVKRNLKSVTLPMDAVLAQKDEIVVGDILKSHLKAWRFNRCSVRSNEIRHWGIRQKPKTELIKELKLATSKECTCDADLNIEKLVLGLDDANDCLSPCSKKRIPVKLLQFDKSNRPAFYGVWPSKSQVVDPRHPFVKDSDIDYDIDSDEDWAEDEPGESLSDCDKDDEDECMEEFIKDDEDNGIEDGFFVPDGYLSEDEGVKSDDSHDLDSEVQNRPISEHQSQNDELCILLPQQKYLNNLTERTLKKNQPLIILNLTHKKTNIMHEKTIISSAEELTGISKLERMALQALTILPFPGFQNTDISVPSDVVDDDPGSSPNKSRTTELSTAADILDSDMPQIISVIQSHPHGIKQIMKSLHAKFPAIPKFKLRNKVFEISEFSNNCRQVKKEILGNHGKSISPGSHENKEHHDTLERKGISVWDEHKLERHIPTTFRYSMAAHANIRTIFSYSVFTFLF
ncbi:chromatin assembly factor 1 subunit FAS1-like isoform X2 [Salvia splendens]|uniref:chromatin assembly factor 1 subunit FAS1-like isoform X2 n=1 Tax=Salvia splendens TaxID=180675 RepID=UPI001C25AF20|nr:chromatin assembly factor 1 subunit FAS1-like isoform X2 [Salvia splendens]